MVDGRGLPVAGARALHGGEGNEGSEPSGADGLVALRVDAAALRAGPLLRVEAPGHVPLGAGGRARRGRAHLARRRDPRGRSPDRGHRARSRRRPRGRGAGRDDVGAEPGARGRAPAGPEHGRPLERGGRGRDRRAGALRARVLRDRDPPPVGRRAGHALGGRGAVRGRGGGSPHHRRRPAAGGPRAAHPGRRARPGRARRAGRPPLVLRRPRPRQAQRDRGRRGALRPPSGGRRGAHPARGRPRAAVPRGGPARRGAGDRGRRAALQVVAQALRGRAGSGRTAATASQPVRHQRGRRQHRRLRHRARGREPGRRAARARGAPSS